MHLYIVHCVEPITVIGGEARNLPLPPSHVAAFEALAVDPLAAYLARPDLIIARSCHVLDLTDTAAMTGS